MAILDKGHDFSDGDQVTAAKLDSAVDSATFAAGSVDNASTQLSGGAIVVKDSGVTAAKLADDSVTTSKILDANVTTSKLADDSVTTSKILDANITTDKILDANVTFAKMADVIDDDTMATATDTTLATSESIKAYVIAMRPKFVNITGATLPISNIKATTGSQTYTYNIADFTSDDVDFSTNKIVGLVVLAYATSGQSSNIVYADLPTGLQTAIVRASADGTSDFDQSQTTTTIPINSGQTSIDITLEVNDAQGTAARFNLMGFIILPIL